MDKYTILTSLSLSVCINIDDIDSTDYLTKINPFIIFIYNLSTFKNGWSAFLAILQGLIA